MGRKRGKRVKSNNNINKANTSQPCPRFVPPVRDKRKNTSIWKGGETGKDIQKKKKIGVSPSDNDTDPNIYDKTKGKNDEDERSDIEDLPPDDDTDILTIKVAKKNNVEDQTECEESPKTDKP